MPRRPQRALSQRSLPAILRGDAWASDTVVLGLTLRPLGGGVGGWSYRYVSAAGQRRHVVLGRAPAMGLDEARAAAEALRRRVADGDDPAATRGRRRGGAAPVLTLAALVERYVAAGGSRSRGRVALAPRTAQQYRQAAKLYLANDPQVADVPVSKLRRVDYRELFARVHEARGLVTANRLHALVGAAVAWAVAWELLPVDYTAGVPRVGAEEPATRALSDAEIVALWRATSDAPIEAAVATRLLLLLGQRPAETLTMRLEDLHGTADVVVWEIPPSRHKARRGHAVPLPRLVLEQLALLGEARALSGWPRDVGRLLGASVLSWRRWWRPIVERTLALLAEDSLEAQPFGRRDLRRTVATGLVRIGVHPATVSRVLGHSTATQARLGGVAHVTASVYVRDRQIRDSLTALTAWSEHVAGLVRGRPAQVVPFARPG